MRDKRNSINLLEVTNLTVSFPTSNGIVRAVNGISYNVKKGETIGIIGESGSGKSVQAHTIIGLLKLPGKIDNGSVIFEGNDMLKFSEREMQKLRGSRIGMIFQDPMSCLDPLFTIGWQLKETLRAHMSISLRETARISIAMLEKVGIRNAKQIMKQYPLQLSGGMLQRVMIAMTLFNKPKLLIADEPTTALDVTIQDQIVMLLKEIQKDTGMSLIFITHDFGIVADLCDKVYVMYGGMMMEQANVEDIFYNPAHPYTKGLLNAIPRVDSLQHQKLITIEGTPIDALHPPKGCVFHPRCNSCMAICRKKTPPQRNISDEHSASCWLLEIKKESPNEQ